MSTLYWALILRIWFVFCTGIFRSFVNPQAQADDFNIHCNVDILNNKNFSVVIRSLPVPFVVKHTGLFQSQFC